MLNAAEPQTLLPELRACSGSDAWAGAVLRHRPFTDTASLMAAAEAAWSVLDESAWRAAFEAAPQPEPAHADAGTLQAARVALELYRQRFGMPFISSARNATADELLMRVRIRLGNDQDTEWRLACEEQRRSARARLQRLVAGGEP